MTGDRVHPHSRPWGVVRRAADCCRPCRGQRFNMVYESLLCTSSARLLPPATAKRSSSLLSAKVPAHPHPRPAPPWAGREASRVLGRNRFRSRADGGRAASIGRASSSSPRCVELEPTAALSAPRPSAGRTSNSAQLVEARRGLYVRRRATTSTHAKPCGDGSTVDVIVLAQGRWPASYTLPADAKRTTSPPALGLGNRNALKRIPLTLPAPTLSRTEVHRRRDPSHPEHGDVVETVTRREQEGASAERTLPLKSSVNSSRLTDGAATPPVTSRRGRAVGLAGCEDLALYPPRLRK